MKRLWLVAAFCSLSMLALPVLALAGSEAHWYELQTSAPQAPTIEHSPVGTQGLLLHGELGGFWYQSQETKGGEFARLDLETFAQTTQLGEARLPMIRLMVEIPHEATTRVSLSSEKWHEISLDDLGLPSRIVPVQPPVPKIEGAAERMEFVIDESYYTSDQFGAPQELARVVDQGQIRGHQFVLLEICPVLYNPADGLMRWLTEFDVEVDFVGGDLAATRDALSRYASYQFDKLCSRLFVNSGQFEVSRGPAPPGGYLIIVYDSFYSDILPLADWKHRKGYPATVTRTSEIPGGPTKENIAAYIETAYDTWAIPPATVLLVGDTGQIPTFTGPGSGTAADLYYVTVEGSDYFPEMFIGRFPGTQSSHIQAMVDKTLTIETADWGSDAFIKKAVFMASEDRYYVSEETHNYVINTYLNPAGYACDKLYCHTYSATTAQVRAAFNDGRSLAVFSGHGATTYWADGPYFSQSDVRGLTNVDMYPFVCSHSCITGTFTYAECFGETWLRESEKGGLAFWGASNSTYWDEDDILERKTFEAWWDDGLTWIGGMTDMGLYSVYQAYGGGGLSQYYYDAYNVLGDPSVDVWSEYLVALDVNHPGALLIGQEEFTITVSSGKAPVSGALACVMTEGGDVYDSGLTDASGAVTLSTAGAGSVGDLEITVTAYNSVPYMGSVPILPPSGPYLTFVDYAIDDDRQEESWGNNDGGLDLGETVEITVTLENIGNETAYDVTGELSSSDPYVTITDDTEDFGDIPPASQGTCLEDFDIVVSSEVPDQHSAPFYLTFTCGDSTWDASFALLIGAPVLVRGSLLPDDTAGGDGDGLIEPGETIELTVSLSNEGYEKAKHVNARLFSDDPFVMGVEGVGTVLSIDPGTEEALSPPYQFTILPDCPEGQQLAFQMDVLADYGYTTEITLTVRAGGFGDDMEGDVSGWTHYIVTGGFFDDWHLTDWRNHTPGGAMSWRCGREGQPTYSSRHDGALVTPPLVIPNNGRLMFWHWMAAEDAGGTEAWDGGILEISTDSGASWEQIFPEGGYPYTIRSSSVNPLPAGTPCYSGSFDWTQAEFDLAAYAGPALVRFRFCSDGSVSEEGWYIDDIEVMTSVTGVDESHQLSMGIPEQVTLSPGFPNPFNPVVTLKYGITQLGHVRLQVYDVTGRLVRTLVDEERAPGYHSVIWDGKDNFGQEAATGLYFCRLTAEGTRHGTKLLMMK